MADLVFKHGSRKNGALTGDIAPETVGFRLGEEDRRLLAQRARKAGVSPHDFARACLIEALHDREQLPAMREAILALGGEISQFKAKFALGVEALLVTANDVDNDQAKAWVEEHLKGD